MEDALPTGATLAIALYGAVLGTIGAVVSVVLAVNQLRNSRPRLRVTARGTQIHTPVAFAGDDAERESWPGIEVGIVNRGPRPVQITGVAIEASHHQIASHSDGSYRQPLPVKLEFSDSFTITFSTSTLVDNAKSQEVDMRKARVLVRDTEDRIYAARLPFNIA